jgi:hypothetical protein
MESSRLLLQSGRPRERRACRVQVRAGITNSYRVRIRHVWCIQFGPGFRRKSQTVVRRAFPEGICAGAIGHPQGRVSPMRDVLQLLVVLSATDQGQTLPRVREMPPQGMSTLPPGRKRPGRRYGLRRHVRLPFPEEYGGDRILRGSRFPAGPGGSGSPVIAFPKGSGRPVP